MPLRDEAMLLLLLLVGISTVVLNPAMQVMERSRDAPFADVSGRRAFTLVASPGHIDAPEVQMWERTRLVRNTVMLCCHGRCGAGLLTD